MKKADDKRTNVNHSKRQLSNKHQNVKIRDLRVVLYRNEIFPKTPKSHAVSKSKLIEEILFREKVKLKLNKPGCDESSGMINELVEQQKQLLFSGQKEGQNDLDSDSDSVGSAPSNVLDAIKKPKKQQSLQNTAFPVIPKYKINKYFALLSSKKKLNTYERELNKCLAHFHIPVKPLWNSPSCIIKAINESILLRKWHNLPQLLLMILQLPQAKYTHLVRNICQIMAKLHPTIQDRGLQDQFNMVLQMHKRSFNGTQI